MQSILDFESSAPDVRIGDYWTCHDAAKKARKNTTAGRRLTLEALFEKPQNDFELATMTGWQQTSIGKRRLECQRLGLVKACMGIDGKQITRAAPSGAMSLVWEITDLGREVLNFELEPT